MKKLNKKGVTLIELIVSFAIVGVAIIYFFQTLYTVKTIYTTSEEETKEYVVKDYGLRLVDEFLNTTENNSENYYVNYNTNEVSTTDDFCKDLNSIETSLYKLSNKDGYSIKKYDVLICY